MRLAIVRALFNAEITSALLQGAKRALTDARVPASRVEIHEVPGAFELPLAAKWLAQTKRFDAIIALGCVIRGETPHFEYVAGEAARGIAQVAFDTGVPVIFGVLTTESVAQAKARANVVIARGLGQHTRRARHGNKGYEAVQSALQMIALRQAIERTRGKRR